MDNQWERVQRLSTAVHRLLGIASGILLMVISLLICSDIVASWLFKSPITGTIEITALIIGWVVAFSFSWGLIKGAQVRVTLLTNILPAAKRRYFDCGAHLLGCLLLCLMSYGAWLFFWSSWQVKEAMPSALMNLPWWFGKLALPVGFALMAAQFLIEFILSIYKRD